MNRKMQYLVLMSMPLCYMGIVWLLNRTLEPYFRMELIWEEISFILATYGPLFAVPIYLAILNALYIFKFKLAIWKGYLFSILSVLLNAILACPYSVWSYITYGEYVKRSTNDYLDMFPVYACAPLILITLLMIVIKTIALIKGGSKKNK